MTPAFRDAIRNLRRAPGFSLLAIGILTLGIGATTAMFSITRTVLLKPLAYREPDRLATLLFRVRQFSKEFSTIPTNAQHYFFWRDHSRTLEEIGLVRPDSHILTGLGAAEQISGAAVTANLIHVLGMQPMLGRAFVNGEDQPGRNQEVIVSYEFWRTHFDGNAGALGRKLFLDGQPYTLVGVMPPGFPFPRDRQLSEVEALPKKTSYWTPIVFSKDDLTDPVGSQDYLTIARLKPGATIPQVVADITALEKVISKRYPEPVEFDPVVRPLQATMAREVRLPLLILMAAVSAVLLIVCINLMNLMRVRAMRQRRDWAIRLAVGAGAHDLLRAAFAESLLLSLAGAGPGSLLALALIHLVRVSAPFDLPRIDELALDVPGLFFALGASVFTSILFGLWPAWRASRIDPQEALQSSGRTSTEGRKSGFTGRLLVAAEVSLSTVLLLGAGLLLRSFVNILGVDPGMTVQHILTVRVNLPPDKYQKDSDVSSFYKRLLEQTQSLPRVTKAGLVSDLPLTGEDNNNPVTAADGAIPPVTQWPMTNLRYASGDYFQAAGIPLKDGRSFEERVGDTREVIISNNLAERLWPGRSAIGRTLKVYGNSRLQTVVGVVGAVHSTSLTQNPAMMVYFPSWNRFARNMTLVVRTATGQPEQLAGAIRRIVSALDSQAAIPSVETMQQIVSASLAQKRFQVMLLGGFAAAALLLACLGIYGVLSFITSRRTSEIGIRMALGATPARVMQSTVWGGMLPVLVGIVIGLALSASFARVFQSLLFGVHALDPMIYAATGTFFIGIAVLACVVPARRAARVNPVDALRAQ
jgi:putative ABC transport system permease protein